MAKKKKKGNSEEEVSEEETPEEEPKAEKKSSKDEVVVKFRDHQGEPMERVYSKKEHGSKYKDLAAQFQKKHAKRLIR